MRGEDLANEGEGRRSLRADEDLMNKGDGKEVTKGLVLPHCPHC